MQTATAYDLNAKRIEAMGKLIDILRRNVRVQYELDFDEVLHAYVLFILARGLVYLTCFSVLPCFADKCSKQCRAAAYRVVRHSLVEASVGRLGDALDWYILKYAICFYFANL